MLGLVSQGASLMRFALPPFFPLTYDIGKSLIRHDPTYGQRESDLLDISPHGLIHLGSGIGASASCMESNFYIGSGRLVN
jgi:hypothetical protein